MSREITDEEFDKLAAEKQHEEFICIMKKLSNVLEGMNDNTEVEIAVNRLNNHLSSLITSGIKVNMDVLANAIKEMVTIKQATKINNPDNIEQWTFHVQRDKNGYIDTVTATKF